MHRNRFWLAGLAACLALAIAGFADHKTGHKKPGGGGDDGGGTVRVVRADFKDPGDLGSFPGSPAVTRIQSDGFVGMDPTVAPGDCGFAHPFMGLWDYWDPTDPVSDPLSTDFCGDGGQIISDGSPGGRIRLITAPRGSPVEDARNRWLVFDFAEGIAIAGEPSPCPDLDQALYGPLNSPLLPNINPDACIDNLEAWFFLDRVFKNKATRQPLAIRIVGPAVLLGTATNETEADNLKLDFVNPLFIIRPVNGNPDVAILTTTGPNGEDVSEAELLDSGNLVIGRYKMPFTIVLRRIVVSQ